MGVINRAPKQPPAPDLAPFDARLDILESPFMKGETLEGFKWYKAFRLNNVPNEPDSAGEGTSVIFEITGQSDFGNTANNQSSRLFASFGVRGGAISPVLTAWGNRRIADDPASIDLRVYKNADGYYWLYIRTAVYTTSQVRYFITNYEFGTSDPLEATDTIYHDGTHWVVPTPTGAGELIWSYGNANAFQPFVIGKGYALTSTDSAAMLIAGQSVDQTLPGGAYVRLLNDLVYSDDTGRRMEGHAYRALENWNGNTDVGPSLHHYCLELIIKQGQAGAELTVLPQRFGMPYIIPHKRILRGGDEVISVVGAFPVSPGQDVWFDLLASSTAVLGQNSTTRIYRDGKR